MESNRYSKAVVQFNSSLTFLLVTFLLPIVALSNYEDNKKINYNYNDSLKAQQVYKKASNFLVKQEYDSTAYYLNKLLSRTRIDLRTKVKSLILLGITSSRNNMNDKALRYYYEALELIKGHDKLIESQIYGNIGELLFNQNDYVKAIYYFKKDIELKKEIKNDDIQISVSNLGAAYIQLQKPKQALKFVNTAFDLAIQSNDSVGQSICINNLATIYRDLKEYDKALIFYEKALKIANENSSKEEKKKILYNLYLLNEIQGKFEKSLRFYQQYIILKDELVNVENNKFIVETQEKYQSEKRLKELAEIKNEMQIKEAESKQFILIAIILAIIIFVAFITIISINRWTSLKSKSETDIQIINASMQGEENQRIKISQEIHDDLGGILGITRMLFTNTKPLFVNSDLSLYERIDFLLMQANTKSRTISHELFSPTLKQFGLQEALKEYISNFQLLNSSFTIQLNCFSERLNQQIELNLYRISQELIINSLKYANAKEVTLEIYLENQHLKFMYIDNGIGFDPKAVKKGVGLNSIEARVKSLKGTYQIPIEESGFKISITIPIV